MMAKSLLVVTPLSWVSLVGQVRLYHQAIHLTPEVLVTLPLLVPVTKVHQGLYAYQQVCGAVQNQIKEFPGSID